MASNPRMPCPRRPLPPPDNPYPYPWVRLRSGTSHPWVYRRMLRDADPTASAGDIVAVYDKQGQHFGHAFYHDRSQIALRMLSRDPAPVDDGFFRDRLRRAIEWRRRLVGPDEPTDVYRLVHAEGDGLPGLIVERYADCLAIEVFALGIHRRIDLMRRLLEELTGLGRFVVRADDRIEELEGFRLAPEAPDNVPDRIRVIENGLRFWVDLRAGHKTGFFCDQRDNRRRLAALCRDADLLDVCCYTGAFGVYASKLGHASTVTGIDLDEKAIELARKNAHLNQVRIRHLHADAFAYLRQMQANRQAYDVVVVDPSKFVAHRDEKQEGTRKYADLNALSMSVVKPGGLLLTCSCSGPVSREEFLGIVKSAANRVRRSLQIIDQTGAAPDHPVMADFPEGAYLKAVWARLW